MIDNSKCKKRSLYKFSLLFSYIISILMLLIKCFNIFFLLLLQDCNKINKIIVFLIVIN